MCTLWRAALLAGVCALVVPQSLGNQAISLDDFASPRGSEDPSEPGAQRNLNVVPVNEIAINRAKNLLRLPTSQLSDMPWRGGSGPFPLPLSPAVLARLFSSEDGLRTMVRRSGRFSRGATTSGEDGTSEDVIDVGGNTKSSMGSKGCFFKVCSFGTHNLQK